MRYGAEVIMSPDRPKLIGPGTSTWDHTQSANSLRIQMLRGQILIVSRVEIQLFCLR